ncbi:MAG: translation elongation factor Ts, partial [Streptomycetaceae bacterium]|nr:translation elongation factor Ts [Streptomycetaceae bacterium]
PGKTVQVFVDEANATLGEKIVLDRFAQFADGYVAAYLHKTSPDLPPQVGVLVELSAENAEVAKDVAQHIAAFAPTYLSREDVPAETVENERKVAEATAREEGKPEAALARIVEGRVTGFYKENVVLEQAFAKDNKKSVQKVLDEAGVSLKRFARFRVGV